MVVFLWLDTLIRIVWKAPSPIFAILSPQTSASQVGLTAGLPCCACLKLFPSLAPPCYCCLQGRARLCLSLFVYLFFVSEPGSYFGVYRPAQAHVSPAFASEAKESLSLSVCVFETVFPRIWGLPFWLGCLARKARGKSFCLCLSSAVAVATSLHSQLFRLVLGIWPGLHPSVARTLPAEPSLQPCETLTHCSSSNASTDRFWCCI